MQRGPWFVVAALALVALGLAGVLRLLGFSAELVAFVVAAALAVMVLPWWLTRRDSNWTGLARRVTWRGEDGRHHAFGGVQLHIEDDGRHVWIGGEGLMRATGRIEPEDVLAARHSGRWRRDDKGLLMLRVDAVVQQLDTSRGRDDPRILRLKHYLERQVLFPAAERRRRQGTGR